MAALSLATPALCEVPQEKPAPACAAADLGLPADLTAWHSRATVAGAMLAIGEAATVALQPVAAVGYAVPPEKPGAAGSFGGSAMFEVASAGTYRVSLSEGAWIDVVGGGKTVASTAHGHGPECTSIRKIVAFPLTAGSYTLQLSGSAKPAIAVLITPAL